MLNTTSAPESGSRKISPLAWVLGLSALFFILFLIVSSSLYFGKSRYGSGKDFSTTGEGSVAIVELNGVIMDSKSMLKRLKSLEDSKEIKAIVLRINSPGGAVAPSQEIYEEVKNYPKPVVASMASVAASGGYYIACGTKKIFANAGTITGSIGVIMEFANLEKLYEWAKVKRFSIKTGKFKDAGAEYREMQPEERALLQGMIDNVLGQFKAAVSEGRKMKMEDVTAIADGRIFSGEQAKAVHLVDEVGTLDAAIKEAAKMGGIKGKPHVIYTEKKKKIWEVLMEEQSDSEESRTNRHWLGSLLSSLLGLPESSATLRAPGVYWLWNGSN
ncbi:MAG: signal peptide peptidase SppA [Methylotenera sp.]|nr:signal peptide peptidase SppA [Oligoflexia bacterium]